MKHSIKKNCKKANQNEFINKKLIKEKGDKLYVKWKGYGTPFNRKKTLYKMSQHFPKSYEPFGGDINVKVDLSNDATKADLKSVSGVDTSKLAAKSDLASSKTEIDKIE